ncbi:MAG: hypothetical protein ACOX87_08945 [Chloroflexota bacterium]|jgi:hypothetical protein
MQRISIIRWQQTQGNYVAILQALDRFKQNSIRQKKVGRDATVLEAELIDTGQRDWYCISFPKEELEFEEAREKAIALVDAENQRRAAGKPSLTAEGA